MSTWVPGFLQVGNRNRWPNFDFWGPTSVTRLVDHQLDIINRTGLIALLWWVMDRSQISIVPFDPRSANPVLAAMVPKIQ